MCDIDLWGNRPETKIENRIHECKDRLIELELKIHAETYLLSDVNFIRKNRIDTDNHSIKLKSLLAERVELKKLLRSFEKELAAIFAIKCLEHTEGSK